MSILYNIIVEVMNDGAGDWANQQLDENRIFSYNIQL